MSLKLAIVGGGPSAFYVASRLLSLAPPELALTVHIYDRLWSPHGLVRYGVAPDHPEVKNCTHKFDAAARDPRLSFFGNVDFITPRTPHETRPMPNALKIPLESLYPHYSHLLFSSGCGIPISHPLIQPSEHCIPALDLVHWYTMHPTAPPPPPLHKLSHITVVGQGNVALDIARILLSPPDSLSKYDVSESVLQVLRESSVKHVTVVGRRGPLQASFTNKELREMMNIPGVSFMPLPDTLLQAPADVSRQQSRLLSLLKAGSKEVPGRTTKSWDLSFFHSPTRLLDRQGNAAGHLYDLRSSKTVLDEGGKAVPTEEIISLDTDLVVTSLGHRADSSSSFYDESTGHLSNENGRVFAVDKLVPNALPTLVRNVYASGWAATGARGVLNATLMNAYSVAQTILADYLDPPNEIQPQQSQPRPITLLNPEPPPGPPDFIAEAWKLGSVTNYQDWKTIDEEEIRRGTSSGKERERVDWSVAQTLLVRV